MRDRVRRRNTAANPAKAVDSSINAHSPKVGTEAAPSGVPTFTFVTAELFCVFTSGVLVPEVVVSVIGSLVFGVKVISQLMLWPTAKLA